MRIRGGPDIYIRMEKHSDITQPLTERVIGDGLPGTIKAEADSYTIWDRYRQSVEPGN